MKIFLNDTSSQRELFTHIRRIQLTIFGYIMRRRKLDFVMAMQKLARIRNRSRPRETMLDSMVSGNGGTSESEMTDSTRDRRLST